MDTQKKREVITNLKEWISALEADIEADIKDAIKDAIEDAFDTWEPQPSDLGITSIELWEPPPGDWWVDSSGAVSNWESINDTRLFGTERPTEPLALRAAEKMRRFNILLAYIDKYAPDYEPDWSNKSEPKYYPRYDHLTGTWARGVDYWLEDVKPYGPADVIDGLIEKLNRGEVVL